MKQYNFHRAIVLLLKSLDSSIVGDFRDNENEKDNELWEVYGYCDSDYSGDKETRVSVS